MASKTYKKHYIQKRYDFIAAIGTDMGFGKLNKNAENFLFSVVARVLTVRRLNHLNNYVADLKKYLRGQNAKDLKRIIVQADEKDFTDQNVKYLDILELNRREFKGEQGRKDFNRVQALMIFSVQFFLKFSRTNDARDLPSSVLELPLVKYVHDEILFKPIGNEEPCAEGYSRSTTSNKCSKDTRPKRKCYLCALCKKIKAPNVNTPNLKLLEKKQVKNKQVWFYNKKKIKVDLEDIPNATGAYGKVQKATFKYKQTTYTFALKISKTNERPITETKLTTADVASKKHLVKFKVLNENEIALEYQSFTLLDILKTVKLTENQILDILDAVKDALKSLILDKKRYMDVKPNNILFSCFMDKPTVNLADLGSFVPGDSGFIPVSYTPPEFPIGYVRNDIPIAKASRINTFLLYTLYFYMKYGIRSVTYRDVSENNKNEPPSVYKQIYLNIFETYLDELTQKRKTFSPFGLKAYKQLRTVLSEGNTSKLSTIQRVHVVNQRSKTPQQPQEQQQTQVASRASPSKSSTRRSVQQSQSASRAPPSRSSTRRSTSRRSVQKSPVASARQLSPGFSFFDPGAQGNVPSLDLNVNDSSDIFRTPSSVNNKGNFDDFNLLNSADVANIILGTKNTKSRLSKIPSQRTITSKQAAEILAQGFEFQNQEQEAAEVLAPGFQSVELPSELLRNF